MNNSIYTVLSKVYGLLDVIYFANPEKSPRTKILESIADEKVDVLDLCCGTMENSLRIAAQRPNARVAGLDMSKPMLSIAKKKIQEQGLKNAFAIYGDATQLACKSQSFDYAIMGLVLHETPDELSRKMLEEVKRVLKPGGKLLVLEWEQPQNLLQRLLFFPIMLMEPQPFPTFYPCDKMAYFEERGFKTTHQYHCDYTTVLELEVM